MTKPETTTHRRGGSKNLIKSQEQHKSKQDDLEAYIPPYLKRFVTPYHGEFCYTRTFHYKLLAQLMMEGFLPIATDGVILPKLHHERCVISLPDDLHVSKSVRKKAKRYSFSVNRDFDQVVEACRNQHGMRCWLYPELVQVFKDLHNAGQVNAVILPTAQGGTAKSNETVVVTPKKSPVRLYSIEVWLEETRELVAGELGYSVGSIYTSLTGFSAQSGAGSVQLAALGRLLCALGFSMWDLGMDMEYKRTLGSRLIPRKEFVDHVHAVRTTKGHLVLPPSTATFNCRAIIDESFSTQVHVNGPTNMTPSSSKETKDTNDNLHTMKDRTTSLKSPTRSPEPDKKKRKN